MQPLTPDAWQVPALYGIPLVNLWLPRNTTALIFLRAASGMGELAPVAFATASPPQRALSRTCPPYSTTQQQVLSDMHHPRTCSTGMSLSPVNNQPK
jgi:hypothetical protein